MFHMPKERIIAITQRRLRDARAYAINCLVSDSGTPSAIISITLIVGCFKNETTIQSSYHLYSPTLTPDIDDSFSLKQELYQLYFKLPYTSLSHCKRLISPSNQSNIPCGYFGLVSV